MGVLKELYRQLHVYWNKPRHWRLRPGTSDRRLFRDVALYNEYQLPPRFGPSDVILDVGAHTGSFALAALRRGAGAVHCWEANPDNFRLLEDNLRPYRGRVFLSPHAVWRSDRLVAHLPFHDSPDPRNTGAGAVSADGRGQAVPARAFDDLIAEAVGDRRVRLVKLDCEGSEWPILLTSRRLHLVDALCGEYHLGDYSGPFAVDGHAEFTPAVLERFLSEQGFRVRSRPMVKDPRLGLFFAERAAQVAGAGRRAG